ncbi:hypothetical protein Tco_0734937, partial [Tanacetum coccineum]
GSGANGGASGSAGGVKHTTRGCSYKEFLNCKPRNFDGTEGAVGLTRELTSLATPNISKNWHYSFPEAIYMDHDLMDQVVRVKVATDADNKRK